MEKAIRNQNKKKIKRANQAADEATPTESKQIKIDGPNITETDQIMNH